MTIRSIKKAEFKTALHFIVWGTEPWLNGIKPWTNPVTDAMKSSEIFPWNYYVYRNDRGTPEVEAFVMEERSILSIEQTHFVTE